MSPETSALNVGAVGPADAGPHSTACADCAISTGISVPAAMIGEPVTELLKITPSPVIAMLVTDPPAVPVATPHTLSPRKKVMDDGVPVADSPAIPIWGIVVESPKGAPITLPPYMPRS